MHMEFDVQLTEKDLYRFNIYQSYTSSQGIVSLILTVLGIIMMVTALMEGNVWYGILYFIFSIIVLFYIPVSLRTRVKLTMKSNAVLSGVLHYEVSEEGIAVSTGEEKAMLPWKQIYKMISTKHSVLIYSGRRNAYVLPKAQLGNQYVELKTLAEKMLEKHRVNLK